MNLPRPPRIAPLAGLLALLCLAAHPALAQQGSVAGTVVEQATGKPLAGAIVTVEGTRLGVQSGPDGRYRVLNVPPGTYRIRASSLGYAAQTREATVTPGGSASADFSLAVSALALDELVVTATGDRAKREVGHAIARVDAAQLTQNTAVANMNDLLVARIPGVQVTPGAITGAEGRIRVRGLNSLSLDNAPVYYIDGIRMESAHGSSSIGVGGTNPDRLSDINPEEIESLEFVKGPSASSLYGTDAANGVIVIKTKKGRTGNARWTAYAEGGWLDDRNTYPTAYRGFTAASTPTNNVQCILVDLAAKTCAQTRVSTFNLFADPDASPISNGHRQQHGLQVSGGSDVLRYFASGEWEDEVGVLQMPKFGQDSIKARRQITELPYEQLRPNTRRRVSARANLGASLSPKLSLDVSTGYIQSRQRLPQTDNNTTGLFSNGFGGPGNKDNGRFGYRLYTPDQFFSETVTQQISRFIGSGTLSWQPTRWLSGRLTGGLDFTDRIDTDLCRRGECTPFSSTTISGFKQDNRTNFYDYTLDGNGTISYDIRPTLTGRSTVGMQYYRHLFDRNEAYAEDLPPGATTTTAGAIPDAAEATTISATLGAFFDQQFGWLDRRYLNAAVRVDDNSAFGANFSAVFYPKVSASWVVSEESFFPRTDMLGNLRLRAAWGASGVQPGTTDAVRYFSPATAAVDNADHAALIFDRLGNRELKPERSTEVEMGLDAALVHGRLSLELTHYRKTTHDALLERTVAPSAGAARRRFENIASVQNRGWEGTLNAQVLRRSMISWDATLTGSHNTNKIASLGGTPPIIGSTISQKEGFPLQGYWVRPYSYADANGDGLISPNEITVRDTAEFLGQDLPRDQLTLSTNIGLFSERLHLSAAFDHRGGNMLWNDTERIRCESRLNCRGLVDPTAPLWEQARVVARRNTAARTLAGYIEKGDFTRLREIAANYTLPDRVAQRVRATRITLTAAARNVHVWTDYTGLDPESGYFSANGDVQNDFQTQPPPSYFTFRATFGF